MSHIVKTKVEMRNQEVLRRTLQELKLPIKEGNRHKLFGSQTAEGIAFALPGWNHPVVVNTETGIASYDNYNEAWGKQIELDKVAQAYTLNLAEEGAIANGFYCSRIQLENGDVELQMEKLQVSA